MIYRNNEPPPLFARRTDPDTSHEAGRAATNKHPDHVAATWVTTVLENATGPMTDEQICDAASQIGCPLSDSRLRHGRKHAADLGLIVLVGKVKLASGCKGRQWRKA